jgi:uncharacterized protein (TIGR03083 family)
VDLTASDISRLYRDSRERLTALVAGLDDAALATPVPACPGWTVQDTVAHLAAVVDDALAGRLAGPPTEEQTAVQVARYAGRPMAGILSEWTAGSPQFEEVIGAFNIPPAVIDVTSHEQDIRGALGLPGARDNEALLVMAGWLLERWRAPVAVRVTVEDAEFRVGPDGDPVLGLRTTRFEAFRWRMGRRSRRQLAGLDWSGDPAPVLDHLVVFGPAPADIME